MTVREKVEIQYKSNRYRVIGLSNRLEPKVGSILEEEEINKLLLEAKQYGELTVTIK